jgi:hypothetical protein
LTFPPSAQESWGFSKHPNTGPASPTNLVVKNEVATNEHPKPPQSS